jgi:bacterioferritin
VLEEEALATLLPAIAHCETVRDYVSREIFKKILENEEEHIDFLQTQFRLIEQIGIENYIQLQANPTPARAFCNEFFVNGTYPAGA